MEKYKDFVVALVLTSSMIGFVYGSIYLWGLIFPTVNLPKVVEWLIIISSSVISIIIGIKKFSIRYSIVDDLKVKIKNVPIYVFVFSPFVWFFLFIVSNVLGILIKADHLKADPNNYSVDYSAILFFPIFEEVFFRGVILNKLLQSNSTKFAMFASSIIFAFAHLDLALSFNAFFIGLYLGFIYVKTRSLITMIILHFLFNFMVNVYFLLHTDISNLFEKYPFLVLSFPIAFLFGPFAFWIIKKSLSRNVV